MNCIICGDRMTDYNTCDKCTKIQELNAKYAGKKIVDVSQAVLEELEGYKGIVLNSDDNGNLEPIISKNIVKILREE